MREGNVLTISAQRDVLPILGTDDGAPAPCSTATAALTCRYRCGDACAKDAPNTSDNTTFEEVVARAMSRRGLLRAGAVIGAAGAIGVAGGAPAAATRGAGPTTPGGGRGPGRGPIGLRVEPVAPNRADAVTVPPGYAQDVVIRWGEPLFKNTPQLDVHRQTTLVLGVGLLGGCTTLSAASLTTARLSLRRDELGVLTSSLGLLLACLAAATVGHLLAG